MVFTYIKNNCHSGTKRSEVIESPSKKLIIPQLIFDICKQSFDGLAFDGQALLIDI